MKTRSAFWRAATVVSIVAACAGVPSLACGEKKGALMLAVTTDMRAPKDVNVVSVAIQVGPQVKYNFIGRVTPEGEVLLPATLAIVEPDDPNAVIKIRVIAFKDTKPRVLRDITTTTPRDGRVALLRLPLSFVNDKSATGALKDENLPKTLIASFQPGNGAGAGGAGAAALGEGTFPKDIHLSVDEFNPFGADVVSVCTDIDQTMIDGECASSRVDAATLVDFNPSLVTRPDNKCFDCRGCFGGGWREVGVDLASCTIANDGEVTNVGFLTTEAGDCNSEGECFVPIDKSTSTIATATVTTGAPLDGWRNDGPTIQLPKGACKKIREGAKIAVVGGSQCESKTASFPVCTGATGTPSADAGASADANADADAAASAPELVVGAEFPSAVGVLVDRMYFGTKTGVFLHRNGEATAQKVGGSPAAVTGPWFISQLGTNMAFADGSLFVGTGADTRGYFLQTGTLAPISFLSAPSGGSVNGVALTTDKIFFPVSDPGSNGDFYVNANFGCCASSAGSGSGNATSIAYVASKNELFVGGGDGEVFLHDVALSSQLDVVLVDATVKPIKGLATAEAAPVETFALREDGIFFVQKVAPAAMTSKRVITDDLTGIDDGLYHPRGIAALVKCGFYASPKGIEYVGTDGATKGVLADMKGKTVLGVAAPVFSGVTDRYVYYAVFNPQVDGGGIYRIKVPASCL